MVYGFPGFLYIVFTLNKCNILTRMRYSDIIYLQERGNDKVRIGVTNE